jgi:hypothetical protein
MSNKHKYFYGDREISEAQALDPTGVLRDGCTCRVVMRDHKTNLWAASDADHFSDGSGDPLSCSRPGFRVRASDKRQAQNDAIAAYDKEISNRWKCHDNQSVCRACLGSGLQTNGNECNFCNGKGVRGDDDAVEDRAPIPTIDASLPLAERMEAHRQLMDKLTAERDAELSNAWRGR